MRKVEVEGNSAMDGVRVKQEILENVLQTQEQQSREEFNPSALINLIDLSSSGSDSENDDSNVAISRKRARVSTENGAASTSTPPPVTSVRTRDPSQPADEAAQFLLPLMVVAPDGNGGQEKKLAAPSSSSQTCKQFWKAGDYEGPPCGNWETSTGGMDHVRVHPKFLHSNATSHKWALGAFAELLDNSLDEVCHGATYVNIDMLLSKKDGTRMLLVEDNGGGMDPDKLRQCMSLGYSAKSKIANTIGQYGNGFKTSTMRLGADVIVFSRCRGIEGRSPSQSIGLLSFTFLRSTGKEDIVVPILDYERKDGEWSKMMRSNSKDWNRNVATIVRWSPFTSEADLLQQFNLMKDQGTRILIYNLWEDDQGQLELDFDSDKHDIQIRGVNRDEKNIEMAKEHPNSKHFLTYRHSFRSYVSILYLRLPPNFRIILRRKDVEHHNIVNDMMMTQEVTYRPQPGPDGVPRDANMVAVVTIGFVKDAKAHIDVQGFNVYHKNRLIKPFWRVWNAAGSDGRGVIGVLEANFVEPAHDKQGFERTTVLARLEQKLVHMQKIYWSTYCHKIGYAPRRNKKQAEIETSPDYPPIKDRIKSTAINRGKSFPHSNQKQGGKSSGAYKHGNGYLRGTRARYEKPSSSSDESSDDDVQAYAAKGRVNGYQTRDNLAKGSPLAADSSLYAGNNGLQHDFGSGKRITSGMDPFSPSKRVGSTNGFSPASADSCVIDQLEKENLQLRERLNKKEEEFLGDLRRDLQNEREKCRSLEVKLQDAEKQIEELNKEQESLIDIFSEERDRRDIEEENLRKKLRDASNAIQELHEKIKLLESKRSAKARF